MFAVILEKDETATVAPVATANCNCSPSGHCKPSLLIKQLMKNPNVKPPSNTALPVELLVAQLVKKFPAFGFRIVFTSARH
jgi:hypothetical protein